MLLSDALHTGSFVVVDVVIGGCNCLMVFLCCAGFQPDLSSYIALSVGFRLHHCGIGCHW